MNIFNKAAFQSLKKNKTRTFVTIIGVALSAAMITGVMTFGISLLHYMMRGAVAKYGDWHVELPDVSASCIEEQLENTEISAVTASESIGYAKLDGSKNSGKPYLYVMGFDDKTFELLPITMISGRLPENDKELLISGSIAVNGGVKYAVGDTISLDVGERKSGDRKLSQHDAFDEEQETFSSEETKTYTVVGICQRPGFEEYQSPGYTVITKTGNDAEKYDLFLTLKNPYRLHKYLKGIEGGQTYVLNDKVLQFMGLSDDNLLSSMLYAVGSIVVIIIMTGSVFMIYNSFHISLNERTQQIGILSSVGATARQIRGSVLFEGMCIGIVGIPIGVILGTFCMGLVISGVAKNFGNVLYADVPLTLTISAPAILAAAVVSMITILISAYIPARKAAKMPVMECIRQTNEIKVDEKSMKISRLAKRVYGLEGILAMKNFNRNKKRYRSIILSLVLSVVLFISASSFVIDLKHAADQGKEVTSYDVCFTTKNMSDDEMISLYEDLMTVDGIEKSGYQGVVAGSSSVAEEKLSKTFLGSTAYKESKQEDGSVKLSFNIQFMDEESYEAMIDSLGLSKSEYTGENAKMIAVAATEGSAVSDLFADRETELPVVPGGQESALSTDQSVDSDVSQDISFTSVDMVPPDILPILEQTKHTSYFLMIMAPYSRMESFNQAGFVTKVKGMTFSSDSPKQSVNQMETMIESAGVTADYNLYNINKMMDESRNYIFIANVFANVFVIMISLIAVANVFNTISTNIRLRRRELAMLRSVGMSEHDFQKMMNFECAFYGMRALIIGLPLAILCSFLIYRGMFIGGADELTFIMPWASIAISTFSVLFIVFITMLYAVSKIKKENIIDALREE